MKLPITKMPCEQAIDTKVSVIYDKQFLGKMKVPLQRVLRYIIGSARL